MKAKLNPLLCAKRGGSIYRFVIKNSLDVLASKRLSKTPIFITKNEIKISPTMIEKNAPKRVLNDELPSYVIFMFSPNVSKLLIKSMKSRGPLYFLIF